MKQSRIRKLVLITATSLIGMFLCCCSSTDKVASSGRFYRGFLHYYFNDSSKIMIGLSGDYDTMPVKGYKKAIRPLNKTFFLYNHFQTPLFRAKTNMEPFFECNASIGSKNEQAFYIQNGFAEKVINSNKFYERVSQKKKKVVLESIIPLANQDVYLVAIGTTTSNKGFTIDFIKQSIKDEYAGILETVIKDEAYSRQCPIDPFEIANFYFDSSVQGNYLLPLKKLEEVLSLNSTNSLLKDFTLQALCTYSTFVNDPLSVHRYLLMRTQSNDDDSVSNRQNENKGMSGLVYTEATSAIEKHALTNQVLMFNESHFQPAHRFALSKMLNSLYARGYRYLALECLNFGDSINERGFPTQSTGFYTREFQMANLIRTASKLGFKLIAYDYQTNPKQSNRELYQATNIYNNTLKRDPSARVVILGGHSHIYENTEGGSKKMMASYFKQVSRIDPFTINQSEYDFFGKAPGIISDGIYIVNNPDKTISGNDLYLSQKYETAFSEIYFGEPDNRRKEISLDITKEVSERNENKILLIHLADELKRDSSAVPCFVKIITHDDHVKLEIPIGRYVFYIKNESGFILEEKTFAILEDGIKF